MSNLFPVKWPRYDPTGTTQWDYTYFFTHLKKKETCYLQDKRIGFPMKNIPFTPRWRVDQYGGFNIYLKCRRGRGSGIQGTFLLPEMLTVPIELKLKHIWKIRQHRYGSGMFIPDPYFFHPTSWIPDPKTTKRKGWRQKCKIVLFFEQVRKTFQPVDKELKYFFYFLPKKLLLSF